MSSSEALSCSDSATGSWVDGFRAESFVVVVDVVEESELSVVVVSTVRLMELLASEPSALVLPAVSENLELAMEIAPSVVLSAVGVKVAE